MVYYQTNCIRRATAMKTPLNALQIYSAEITLMLQFLHNLKTCKKLTYFYVWPLLLDAYNRSAVTPRHACEVSVSERVGLMARRSSNIGR